MEDYLLKRNFYNKKIIYGNNIYLYDDEDNEIIDGCSNSMNVNLGYNVKELENRFKAQLRKIRVLLQSFK
ncbi:hypothetical protein DQ181_13090 [Enterococcus faecium]|nr:hypothetical protein [Enterococcus faecium]